MADSKQCHIAELMTTSESSVSRMKEGDIARLSLLLAVLGLKVVPDSTKVFDPNLVQALTLLARDNLSRLNLEDWAI